MKKLKLAFAVLFLTLVLGGAQYVTAQQVTPVSLKAQEYQSKIPRKKQGQLAWICQTNVGWCHVPQSNGIGSHCICCDVYNRCYHGTVTDLS